MGELIQFPVKHAPGRSCTTCRNAFIGTQGLFCSAFMDIMFDWRADDCSMWESDMFDEDELDE